MTDREHNQDHQEHTCTGETEQNTQLIDLSEIGMTALGAGEKAAVFTGADSQ